MPVQGNSGVKAGARSARTAGKAAAEMRAGLGARQEAEALLAEASEARRSAAVQADEILEKAQEVANELVGGAQRDAEHEMEAAGERAAGIVAKAKDEADEILRGVEAECERIRAEAEAEVQEFRERIRAEAAEEARSQLDDLHRQAGELLGGLDERFGAVRASLAETDSSVRITLEQLGRLREAIPGPGEDASIVPLGAAGETATEGGGASSGERSLSAAEGEESETPFDALARRRAEHPPEVGEEQHGDEESRSKETRPLGWLFRNQP